MKAAEKSVSAAHAPAKDDHAQLTLLPDEKYDEPPRQHESHDVRA